MALSTGELKPPQMPLLLDAFDEASTPVVQYLEPWGLVVWELRSFHASGVVGPTLKWWTDLHGQPAAVLAADPERYFMLGGTQKSYYGAADEEDMLVMYCGYRCTSRATSDRHAYFASEEMTALILAGSEGSADVGVTLADLPSPSGVAYLTQAEGGLVLLWNTIDNLLSVQLVPTTGARDFIVNLGEKKVGWGYRFGEHKYLPMPFAEAELSDPESDSPPTLQNVGGYTPGMPDDAPDWSRKGIYQGWTSEQILAVFLSFTHMLRQGALVDSSTIRTAKSSLSGRRRKPGLVMVFGHFAGVPRTQTVATIVVILLSAVPTLWIDETTSFAAAFGVFVSTGVLVSLVLGVVWFLARYVRVRRDSRLSNFGGELGGVGS